MRTIELCCGSAAWTLSHFGVKPLRTQWGSKLGYVPAIHAHTGKVQPDESIIVDIGPWPRTMATVMDAASRAKVARKIQHYSDGDAPTLHAWMRDLPVPDDDAFFAAMHLTLQCWNYRRKAVAVDGDRWVTHGFNTTEGLGRAPSATFGGVNPQLPSVARRVATFPSLPIECITADVRDLDLSSLIQPGRTRIYVDWPYIGTTGYTDADPTRAEQIELLRQMVDLGAEVISSECVPLDVPGWGHVDITNEKRGKKRAYPTPEWLTCSPGVLKSQPVQVAMFGGAA